MVPMIFWGIMNARGTPLNSFLGATLILMGDCCNSVELTTPRENPGRILGTARETIFIN